MCLFSQLVLSTFLDLLNAMVLNVEELIRYLFFSAHVDGLLMLISSLSLEIYFCKI